MDKNSLFTIYNFIVVVLKVGVPFVFRHFIFKLLIDT